MIDTLKLIAARSEAAMHLAVKAIQAARAGSPVIQNHYNHVAGIALSDLSAQWTPEERAQIVSHLGGANGGSLGGRTSEVRVRLTEHERVELERLAENAGQSISEYIRRAVFE